MSIFELVATLEASLPWALAGAILIVLIAGDVIPGLRFAARDARAPAAWGLAEVAVVFALYLGVSIAAGVLVGGIAASVEERFIASSICHLISIAAIITYVRNARQPLATLGLGPPRWRDLPPALAACIASLPPLVFIHALWWLAITAALGSTPADQSAVEEFTRAIGRGERVELTLLAILAVVVAPIGEEIFYRGFVFGALRARMSFVLAAVVSSAIFSLVHLSRTAFVPLFFVGFLLAWIYERTGRLLPAMLYHAGFNALQLMQIAASG